MGGMVLIVVRSGIFLPGGKALKILSGDDRKD